jgi:hypothetical protein
VLPFHQSVVQPELTTTAETVSAPTDRPGAPLNRSASLSQVVVTDLILAVNVLDLLPELPGVCPEMPAQLSLPNVPIIMMDAEIVFAQVPDSPGVPLRRSALTLLTVVSLMISVETA